MLATGQSASLAINELLSKDCSEKNIKFLNIISCPEGLKYLHEKHPKVQIYTASIDDHLNDQKYIVPGIGDMGDRYYGTT